MLRHNCYDRVGSEIVTISNDPIPDTNIVSSEGRAKGAGVMDREPSVLIAVVGPLSFCTLILSMALPGDQMSLVHRLAITHAATNVLHKRTIVGVNDVT